MTTSSVAANSQPVTLPDAQIESVQPQQPITPEQDSTVSPSTVVDTTQQPAVDDQDAATINGTGSGKSLPPTSTTDGKTITRTQLADGQQAEVTREVTGGGTMNMVVFTTKGDGNDNVQVTQNDDGVINVNVNGETYDVTVGRGQELAIRVGNGDDVINVAPNVKVNIIADGGAGNDQITTGAGEDRIDGGEGDDVISSGDGRDDVFGTSGNDSIEGGEGNNVLYGGDGDDQFTAGTGTNFMEGGAGNDTFDGSKGVNKISGGLGDDRVISGGTNAVYTGQGADTVVGATTNDKIYAQEGVDAISFAAGQADNGQVVVNVLLDPNLGHSVQITGSDAFKQRVAAELEFLRSSPNGQQMLAEFDKAAEKGHVVTIRELQNERNGYAQSAAGNDRFMSEDGKPGTAADVTITYNPSFHADGLPLPITTLYHEMSHAYNGVNGTYLPGVYKGSGPDGGSVNNRERQAVGLETTAKPYDFDGDPNTPATTHNPYALTENGMRTELGMPLRESYS